jgi:hypothetical protein
MSREQLRAVHGATSVAMAYGFKVEVEPHGLMRFRNCGGLILHRNHRYSRPGEPIPVGEWSTHT